MTHPHGTGGREPAPGTAHDGTGGRKPANESLPWRFIPASSHDGFTNMSIDEAILQSHIAGNVPPTLRLYFFAPPAVTIGLNQKMSPDAIRNINARGIDVVRRPTGGRAVLHLDDLTYSFIGTDISKPNGFLSTSVTGSYKEICAALCGAFSVLGIETEVGATGVSYRHLQDCFLATTSCDLHYQGTKLIGSAQVRRGGCVLQHGSVPLRQDPNLMSEVLEEPASPLPRHRNLFDIAGREFSQQELEDAFKEGFASAFNVSLVPAKLTPSELRLAAEIQRLSENGQPRAHVSS
jgi:lipoate-protein ligase A